MLNEQLWVLGWPAVAVVLQRWVGRSDQPWERFREAAAFIAIGFAVLVVIAFLIRHEERKNMIALAIPASITACAVVGLGALAVRYVLPDASTGAQIAALYVGSLLGSVLVFMVCSLTLLGLLWSN